MKPTPTCSSTDTPYRASASASSSGVMKRRQSCVPWVATAECIRRRICLGQGMAIGHGRADAGRMSARDLDQPGRGVDADDLGAPAGDGFAQ